MESEQYMKMVEEIRLLLSRGSYMLDGDALPYHGQAEVIANNLWIAGYRPAVATSVVYHRLHTETEAAWVQLWALRNSLQARLDLLPPEHEEHAGLRYAIEEIQSRYDTVDRKRNHWMGKMEEAIQEEFGD